MFHAARAAYRSIFKRLSPLDLAKDELHSAEIQLLALLTAREYTEAMVAYRKAQINRLRSYINELDTKQRG